MKSSQETLATASNATIASSAIPRAGSIARSNEVNSNHATPGFASTTRCIFGCAQPDAFCRFPNDPKRLNNWLRYFQIDTPLIPQLGDISNLRVCLSHFTETLPTMAKTRIKNTPTRLQGALLSSSLATAAGATVTTDVKSRLRQPSSPKEMLLEATSTIIIPATKRASSICSTTSTVSQASETPSAHSDTDSLPPQPTNPHPPKTFNRSLLRKPMPTIAAPHVAASLKNRKVYMITEKSDSDNNGDATSANASGQKRKMYLIMEENGSDNGIDTQKYLKSDNGNAVERPNKVTLYADNCSELTENFEKILPEILNRIQNKNGLAKLQNGCIEKSVESLDEPSAATIERRLPITLPPKKNRTKILTSNNGYVSVKQTSAATPVIVSPSSQLNNNSNNNINNNNNNKNNNNNTNNNNNNNNNNNVIISNNNYNNTNNKRNNLTNVEALHQQASTLQTAVPQKNINLSTDFLFLMKMLPKLESIPEPRKNYVKNTIDKIISQNVSKVDDDI